MIKMEQYSIILDDIYEDSPLAYISVFSVQDITETSLGLKVNLEEVDQFIISLN